MLGREPQYTYEWDARRRVPFAVALRVLNEMYTSITGRLGIMRVFEMENEIVLSVRSGRKMESWLRRSVSLMLAGGFS
jgi:hypothetical protein